MTDLDTCMFRVSTLVVMSCPAVDAAMIICASRIAYECDHNRLVGQGGSGKSKGGEYVYLLILNLLQSEVFPTFSSTRWSTGSLEGKTVPKMAL